MPDNAWFTDGISERVKMPRYRLVGACVAQSAPNVLSHAWTVSRIESADRPLDMLH
jgi:hypothetical protein